MRNKIIARFLSVTLAAGLSAAMFTKTAFAGGGNEAALLALMEVEEEPPAVCTCSMKCEAGAVNTACPACTSNMTACAGKTPGSQEPEEPEQSVKEDRRSAGAC